MNKQDKAISAKLKLCISYDHFKTDTLSESCNFLSTPCSMIFGLWYSFLAKLIVIISDKNVYRLNGVIPKPSKIPRWGNWLGLSAFI